MSTQSLKYSERPVFFLISKYYSLLLFWLMCTFSFAQTPIIDSLLLQLKKTKEDSSKIKIFNQISWQSRTADCETAIKYANEAILLAKQPKISETTRAKALANAHNTLGIAFHTKGDYDLALENYAKAAMIKEKLDDKKGASKCFVNMGIIYDNKNEYDKALENYIKALTIQEELGDKTSIASSYGKIGNILNKKGENKLVLEYYSKALKIYEGLGNKKGIADSYNNMGNFLIETSEYDNALVQFTKALKMREEIGDKNGIAKSLGNIGNVYSETGDYDQALNYYNQSLKTLEKLEKKDAIAGSIHNIAIIHMYKGDFEKALESFYKSAAISEQIGAQAALASSYNGIGLVLNYRGDYERALDFYLKSINIYEKIGDKPGASATYNNMALIYNHLKDYKKSLEFHHKSLQIKEEVGDRNGIADSYNNIGAVYMNLLDYEKAMELHNQSKKIKEEIGDKSGLAASFNNIADIYLKKGYAEKAKESARKALDISLEMAIASEIRPASRSLINAHIQTKQLDSAAFYLSLLKNTTIKEMSVNYFTLSEREKELYFSTIEEDLERYYEFTLGYSKQFPYLSDSAYNLALANKGLSLKSSTAMRQVIMSSGDSTLIGEYNTWLNTKKKISKLYAARKDTKEAEEFANLLEKGLIKKSKIFDDFNKVKNLNWQQVQKGLKINEAAIEFVQYKSEIDTLHPLCYAALLIKKGSKHPETIFLCTEIELEKIIGTLAENNFSFVNGIYGTKKVTKSSLYEKVWLPLEQSLENIKTIYYSPCGLLNKISFSALTNSKHSYLCDTYKLYQQGSTGNIVFTNNSSVTSQEKFILIGGVQYNPPEKTEEIWQYLPGTLTEIENISNVVKNKGASVKSYSGIEADESCFKKNVSAATILHVATHGFFYPNPEKLTIQNESKPTNNYIINFRGMSGYANWSFVKNKNPLMRSGIVLSGANGIGNRDSLSSGEDGVLTAQEVTTLNLQNTTLVVLSACETGLGDVKGSEGVYGLQRAFKMAGAKWIIMSLWQVPDKETSEFMTSFYSKLTKEKNIKSAFVATQLEMRKKYDPYFWAAFVLIE